MCGHWPKIKCKPPSLFCVFKILIIFNLWVCFIFSAKAQQSTDTIWFSPDKDKIHSVSQVVHLNGKITEQKIYKQRQITMKKE